MNVKEGVFRLGLVVGVIVGAVTFGIFLLYLGISVTAGLVAWGLVRIIASIIGWIVAGFAGKN